MAESKTSDSKRDEESIPTPSRMPLPIQSFLWRQTEPFLRRKIGKLYEASCMSFEHVLVENKLQGLPPSLSGAIESITRWQLIDACLPHVMHCAALLISNRNKLGQADKFGVPATKLLHTLHWIFIDFANESSDDTGSSTNNCISFENIQLFVYLFAPILNSLKETDLTFRLASGQKIWKPMWNFEHPKLETFNIPIKKRPSENLIITVTPAIDESFSETGKISPQARSTGEAKQLTLFDVAVLNCLMHERWSEDGVLWGITYLLKKVQKSASIKGSEITERSSHRRCQSLINRKPESQLGIKKSITILSPQRENFTEQSCTEASTTNTPPFFLKKRSASARDRFSLGNFAKKSTFKSSLGKVRSSPAVSASNLSKVRKFTSSSVRRLSITAMASKLTTPAGNTNNDKPPSYNSISFIPSSSLVNQRLKKRRNTCAEQFSPRQTDGPPSYSQVQNFNVAGCSSSGAYSSRNYGKAVTNSEQQGPHKFKLPTEKKWTSDTCLNFKDNLHGLSRLKQFDYADPDGGIRVEAVLSVLNLVVSRNPGLRLLDICLQILDCLFQMRVFSYSEGSSEVNINLLRILHGLTRHLGCLNGCTRSGHRNTATDKFRATTRLMITNVFSMQRDAFCNYVKGVIQSRPLPETMDFLHPLLAYCTIEINNCEVRELNDEILCANAAAKTLLEDVVVKTTFRDVVEKCIQLGDKMYSNENKSLYEEVRHLVQFVRVRHPSAFNQVLLTIMSVPMRKRRQWLKEQEPKKTKRNESIETSTPLSTRAMRRGGIELSSSPLLSKRQDKRNSSKPSSIFRLSMEFLDRSSLGSSHAVANSTGLAASNFSITQDMSSDEEDQNYRPSFDGDRKRFNKIGSIFKMRNQTRVPLGTDAEDDVNSTFFSRMIKKKMTKKVDKEDDIEFDSFKTPHFAGKAKNAAAVNNEFTVDEYDISNGSKILRFLMDCCPPGTVPEPNVLGSVMGLESPVISRATVFLQCANFVENCSNSDWPRWMQNRIMQSKRCHKNAKFYTTAAKLFQQWGETVSCFLEKVLALSNDPKTVLGDVRSKEEQRRNYDEDLKENFLHDLRVNDTGKKCPTALSMTATDLLYQVTVFLRDVYPRLPHQENIHGRTQALDNPSGLIVVPQIKPLESPCRKTIKFSDNIDQQLNSCFEASRTSGQQEMSRDVSTDSSVLKSSAAAATRRASTCKNDTADVTAKGHVGLCTTSGSASGANLLTVPTNNLYLGGNFSPFSSCSRLSFGSSLSLGNSSVLSEYTSVYRDSKENNAPVINTSPSPKPDVSCVDNLPWVKVMLALTNQQNFLCNHMDFCHPFCHQRITRSCNRLLNAIHGAVCNSDEQTETSELAFRKEQSSTTTFTMYLKNRASVLTKVPLSVLLKAVTVLSDEILVDTQALCWEIMLDGNKCTTKVAASLFLLSAYRIPDEVHTCIMGDLCHSNPHNRVRALRKLRVLWDCRYYVWKNTEIKARQVYKMNVPSASFTLSHNDLGLETAVIPDPPWVSNIINIDEILAQNSSSAQGAAFLATDTLSHYKEQQLKKLLQRESEQRTIARSKFHLTDVPLTQTILAEVRKKVNMEEFEDESSTCSSRRLSSRLPSVGSNTIIGDSRKEDWKRHSRTRINNIDGNSQENVYRMDHIAPLPSSPAYPPCIAACLPTVLQLTSDVCMTKENQSVGDIARNLVTSCLSEDASLFLRSVIEKMTDKNEQFHSLWVLRRLPNMLPDISPLIAHVLFSHLVEAILHYNRLATTNEDLIASALLAMTSLIPSIQAIDLKTLKLALRKEQIDTQILITAGIPGAKKLTVWNQGDYYMPTQIEVTDSSTFDSVLREALVSIDVPESEHRKYQLFDRRKNQILCRHCYVRDFYQFRKAVYPELNLVEMDEDEGTKLMTDRVIALKLVEIARVKFVISALCHQKSSVDQQLNATFIQDELNKLWSFPRKAMDAEFFLFDTTHGDIIRQLDVVQKFYWVDFVVTLFLSLSKDFPWEEDLLCFMHVLSASLVVHCEEPPLLRRFSAAVIDVIVHLAHTFTLPGYSLILPSMLCIYSKHHDNDLIRSCLELVFKMMFKVHRQPFILQLFANAAPLLSEFNWLKLTGEKEPNDQLSHEVFFQLLLALQSSSDVDHLQVMSLVKAEKPLKPVDECLGGVDTITFSDYFRLCITVIAYQPETSRTLEMLIVINSILPCYLDHMQATVAPMEEYILLNEMSVSIRFLLTSVEVLTRTIITASQQHTDQPQGRSLHDLGVIEEGVEKDDCSDGTQTTEEFVAPRDVILQLCTTFYTHTRGRMQMLKPSQTEEFLNVKSHIRLAEIAHSLLKLLTDESVPTISLGLAYYIKRMLPIVDWSIEAVRPALFLVLKRLDRFFGKISKVYSFRRNLDWRTVSMMVSGLCDLLARQPAVSHIPHLKTFVNMSATMQVGTNAPVSSEDSSLSCGCKTRLNISATLTPNVVKLIVLQAQGLGEGFAVQDILKPLIETERKINLFLNLIIPICFCVAGETPVLPHANDSDGKVKWKLELPKSDVVFMMNLCVDALTGKYRRSRANMAELFLATSPLSKRQNDTENEVALLTLRVVIACFHKQLQGEWYGLAQKIKTIACKYTDGSSLWSFMIFVMKYKTPLVLHLKPFVLRQFMKRRVELAEEAALKKCLQNCLQSRKCVPIVMTLLIEDLVREAQELRQLCQQPKGAKSPTPFKASSNISLKSTSNQEQNSFKERSRLSSFRCAISSLPKNQTQHDSIDEKSTETDKLLVRPVEKTLTAHKSPPAARLWSQLMRSRSNRDEASHEPGNKLIRGNLSFTPSKEKASTSKPNNIPNITVDMYVTPKKTASVLRQTTLPEQSDRAPRAPRLSFSSEEESSISPKLTKRVNSQAESVKIFKMKARNNLCAASSSSEASLFSHREDSVTFVNEEKPKTASLSIDESSPDRPASAASFDDAKRTLHKLVLRSSFRR